MTAEAPDQRGVPMHPALVHFPVVFFCLAPGLEILALSGWYVPPLPLAWWCTVLGVFTALPAMALGFYDAYSKAHDEQVNANILRHVYWVVGAWSCFCISLLLSPDDGANLMGWVRLGLQLIGILLLLSGAHQGGRLVHVYGVSGRYR